MDHGRIVIASTFRSQEVDLDRISMFPDVFINGKNISVGGSGSTEPIDDNTYRVFSAMNIEDTKIDQDLKIRISYNNIFNFDTGRSLRGKWDFQFEANGEMLMAETKTIDLNKEIKLDNGQQIIVTDLKISPFSTMLSYNMINGSEYDVFFEVEDQDGNKMRPISARTLSEKSYNRFDMPNDNTTKLTITPMVRCGLEGEEKRRNFEVLEEHAFEVDVK
ncbi:hypothetical protein GGQ84_002947 [Desulfitispora alkaliphila]|uniref:DUF5643 domain-containing protein n=1 Tax=Desulfitispora alkaliphila TaxID=622674 RepID=UPI003D220E5B